MSIGKQRKMKGGKEKRRKEEKEEDRRGEEKVLRFTKRMKDLC